MGIFKNITRTLKKAAPLIGSAIGMYVAGPGYAALGGALGGGIGSLVGGGDTEDALTAAALGGLAGYAGSKFMSPSNTANTVSSGKQLVGESFGFGAAGPTEVAEVAGDIYPALQKSSSFFTSPTGIATLGLGAAALGGLGEEEKIAETTMQPYPVGKSRLGMGRIGDKFYNLNDEDERRQYFEDLRNRNKDKDKDDDEVVTMSSGGLAQIRDTINQGIMEGVMPLKEQIDPFLNQVSDMAQKKFGVDITKNPTGMPGLSGGLGMPNANQLGNRLPAFTDDMANRLFEAGKNQMGSNAYAPSGSSRSDIKAAYMPIDQGDGIDQFGKPMETTGSTTVPKDSAKALELFGNAFNRGVSTAASSPFGAGQSRLGGIGAIGSLFMNNGGEVEGPGTGTSDSVPARLSDGEFVLTAKAVRGAGGGDRDLGAARMYDMMSSLERVA